MHYSTRHVIFFPTIVYCNALCDKQCLGVECCSLITSREVNEERRPHACNRPCALEAKKRQKSTKSRRTNTPRNPQQPGDRDHLETACDETRPTRLPMLARFIDPGVLEIGLVQLSQSVKLRRILHIQRQTGRQTD